MHKGMRRSLFAAAFAGTALVGCGGGGGSGGSGSPPPPPPPPPAGPGSYFQLGRASTGATPSNIPFFAQPLAASPFGLVFWDPLVAPNAFQMTTDSQSPNHLEAGGIGLDLATVSEYAPSGGTATAWGIRYRVYAEAQPNGDALLKTVDLRKATANPPNPGPVQVSSGTFNGMALCPISSAGVLPVAPALFDNYSAAGLSWIVFHAKGPDLDCGTLDDQILAVQVSMSSGTAPKALAQLEPVEATYDVNGTITGFLALNHPAVCTTSGGCSTTCNGAPFLSANGEPTCPVPLQKLDPSFAATTTLATNLSGKGSNLPGGDFRSLGISSGNIWLYVDSVSLWAVDVTSGTQTQITGFSLGAADVVQGRAMFDPADATKAYVAFASNSAGGSTIVQVNLSTKTAIAQAPRDAAGASGITLVGVTSGNVVYLINNGSGIKALAKSTLTGLVSLTSLSGSQVVDSLMGPNGAVGPPVAFLVGDTVYYTVADPTATANAKRPFFASAAGGAPTAIGSGTGAVLGAVAPSMIPTAGPYVNVGAVVLTGGPNGSTAGQAVFANSSGGATLGLYGAGGTLSTTVGSFTTMNPSSSLARANPITGVALNGPVQAGMPASLETYGGNGTGTLDNDFAIFTADMGSSLEELSGFLQ
jgi:hypothetical protein